MAKYSEYRYGGKSQSDSYVAFMVVGRKVVKVVKKPGELPVMETTNMSLEEYKAIPLPEDRL